MSELYAALIALAVAVVGYLISYFTNKKLRDKVTTLEEFIREHEEELPKKYAIETSDGRYWKSSYAEPYADVSDDVNRYGFLFDSERDAENILRRIKYNYDENYWGSSFEDQEFEIVEIIL